MSLKILDRICEGLQAKARELNASVASRGETVHGEALQQARDARCMALALLFTAEAIASAVKAEG